MEFNYNKVSAEDLEQLVKLTDESRVITEIPAAYTHDEMGACHGTPEVLVRVNDENEVAEVLKYATERSIPVVVRGAGTGLMGGSVAVVGGIMMEMMRMNQILSLDEENMMVTVQPGVLLTELNEYLAPLGYFYAPDPGEKSAALGGNISTNAGGMRAVKYGVTRDHVMALRVVLPTGEILDIGGKTVKNSSGYSLKDLVVGSEGTLCVIVEATLKILPIPGCTASVLLPFENIQTAVNAVPMILRSGIQPVAVEYMEREMLEFSEKFLDKKFPDSSSDAYILMTFDGKTAAEVEAIYMEACEMCIENGAIDAIVLDTDERMQSVWSARGAFLDAVKGTTEELDEADIVVPRSKIVECLDYLHEISATAGIRIHSFGHAGDGNIHVLICRDDLGEEEWTSKLKQTFDMMYAKVAEIGGQVSGEHGIGAGRQEYLKKQLGDSSIALMNRIKAAFDPANILNPGKVCQKFI